MAAGLISSRVNGHHGMAAGALLRAADGSVLLVKPTYKPTWDIPGGVLEPGESPRGCCEREIVEELGLDLPLGRLLVVDCAQAADPAQDQYRLVYGGGVITDDVSSGFVLPTSELTEWRLVPLRDVERFASVTLAQRIRLAHDCAIAGTTAYAESGVLRQVFSPPPQTQERAGSPPDGAALSARPQVAGRASTGTQHR